MDAVLSAILGSMHTDLARMDRVAMNMANAQSTGYKREVLIASPFGAQVEAGARAVHIDERPGTLKTTSQALDFALAGPGWFEVATPEGTAYTRQGNFRLDAAGRLVTQQGYPVMGLGGEIHLLSGTPVVDGAGRVFENAGATRGTAPPVAQLKVVQFEGGAQIQRAGEGMVQVRGTPRLAADASLLVKQGFLENSNVNHMSEMVRLLETVRHLETMQKVALGYDEMQASAIRKLGEPT